MSTGGPVFTSSHLSGEIKRLALEAGFDLAGIAPAADAPEHALFPQWIANGTAGEMRYLEARNEAGELKRASLASAVLATPGHSAITTMCC